MQRDNMTAVTISGPIDRLDEAVRRFVVDRPFHPEDAVEVLSDLRRLKRVQTEDPYTECLAQADMLLGRMGLSPEYTEYGEYEVSETEEYLRGLLDSLDELERTKNVDETDPAENEPFLYRMTNVQESLKDLWEMRYICKRFGFLPEKTWEELEEETSQRNDELVVEFSRDKGMVFGMVLAVPERIDELDITLAKLGFDRVRMEPERAFPDCTAAELIARREAEKTKAEAAARSFDDRLQELVESEGQELLRRRAWLAYQSACQEAKGYAGQNYGRFYLAGWAAREEAETVDAACDTLDGFSCVLLKPREVRVAKPPVRIRETGVQGILSPLMKMYGTPAYGTADPRIFMVISYTIFFGMMFGDAGQGACLAILGFLLYRKNKNWLWRIIGICGCSAVVFGLIYGSVFGLEDLLPWGGYHPLEADHIMMVLLAGAAVGVVVILVCMAFNIVNALRMGDLKNAFFSPNGVAGAVLYLAVIAGIVCAYTGWAKLFTAPYIICLILLPILLIWMGEPLGKLLAGEKNWQPESWGMYIVEGFFDLFEAAISYMSNTMSFLRLGAFAISHAGMMMVVSMLTQNARAAGTVIGMVLGNILVAALEAALSSIQIIRLEFYEIFGRFYVGGGREFSPVTVKYSR